MKDRVFLEWLYDRLIHVFGEKPTYDYMHKFRSIIRDTDVDKASISDSVFNCVGVDNLDKLSEHPIDKVLCADCIDFISSSESAHANNKNARMCAVALLFHKELSRGYIQRVRVCFVDRQEGDDDYILKAKAERYFREHEDFKDSLKGFHIAAWQVVIGRSNVTLDKS